MQKANSDKMSEVFKKSLSSCVLNFKDIVPV